MDMSSYRLLAANACGAAAVYSSFEYVTIATRLEEASHNGKTPLVKCVGKLLRVLVRREALWLLTFALLGAWTSMAGIPLFLLYPVWRRYYRRALSRGPR